MKRTALALGLLLAVILLATASPILAGPPQDAPSTSMLVALAPLPSPGMYSMEASSIQSYVSVNDQRSRLIPILNSLKKRGHLRGFGFVAGTNALHVDAPDGEATVLLSMLPGINGMVPATPQNIEAAHNAFRASLTDAFVKMVRPPVQRPLGPLPVVNVHETWDTVQGENFSPSTSVQAVLRDSSATVKAEVSAFVNGDGRFSIDLGTDVVQDDSVEIIATADTYDQIIQGDAITIGFDYVNDQITGHVTADRAVHVQVTGKDTGMCNDLNAGKDVTADGSGNFSADFTGAADINAHATVDVSSIDGNGNAWIKWRHAPYLRVNFNTGENGGWGFASSLDDDLSITLKDAFGVEKQTVTPAWAPPETNFVFHFDRADILPGDTIVISESGTPWATLVMPTLTTSLNPVSNLITGSRPTGEPVTVMAGHYNRTNGNWEGRCQVVPAGGNTYSQAFPVNYAAGDNANAYFVYGAGDTQGDDVNLWDNAPYMEMFKDQNVAQGSFHSNFNGEATIVVRNAAGAVKYSDTAYAYGGWWQKVLAKGGLPVKLLVGDKVTVTPIGVTGGALTATVARVTASIGSNGSPMTISGVAPAKAFLGAFNYVWMGGDYLCEQCWEKVQTDLTGHYSFPFKRTQASGNFVRALYVDATGHHTIASAFSTHPTMTLSTTPAPTLFRRGRPNYLNYAIAGGEHAKEIYVGMDSVAHPDWDYSMQYGTTSAWPWGSGSYTFQFWFPTVGRAYYRGFALVDGQFIYTSPELWAPVR